MKRGEDDSLNLARPAAPGSSTQRPIELLHAAIRA